MNVKKQLLIAAGLAGSVAAGQHAVSADQVQKHTVANGETLSALASRFNTTVAQLASDNQIQNVDQIYQGQELIIGVANTNATSQNATTQTTENTYRVQAGDNLWTLAQKFGLSVDQLAQENNIKDANQIFVGQTLTIKNASQQVQQTTAASQSSSQAAQNSTSQVVTSQAAVSQAVTSAVVVSQAAVSQAPASQSASSQAAVSQAPVSQSASSQAAVSQTPASQSASSQAAVSQAPASQSASSQAAVSQAPASQAPASQAAATSTASQSVQDSTLDYDQAEQQALQTIIMKESGGNVNATNGIYFGIGQLSPTIRARYGGNSTDYQDQLQAMKAYIAARYGSAQAALAHHLQYGWY